MADRTKLIDINGLDTFLEGVRSEILDSENNSKDYTDEKFEEVITESELDALFQD